MIDLAKMTELSIGGVKLRELSVGGVRVWQAPTGERLPEGYTEVEWIESDGNCWIDTGITGHVGLSVEIVAEILSPIPDGNATLIGSTNSNSQRCYLTANKSTAPFRWEFGAGTFTTPTNTFQFNTEYTVKMDWSTENSTLTVDGSPFVTIDAIDFDNGATMLLFARKSKTGTAEKLCKARVKLLKMRDFGETLGDFVPAVRDDNTVGLYDLVSGDFYTNGGTGTLTAGPAVGEE